MQGSFVIKINGPEGWSLDPDKVLLLFRQSSPCILFSSPFNLYILNILPVLLSCNLTAVMWYRFLLLLMAQAAMAVKILIFGLQGVFK